jgi:hypothetical protein
VRREARARRGGVQRELAIAIEPRILALIFIEAHDEAAAARAHEKAAIDLAAGDELL